jgi:hypothetical protein
MAGFFHTHRSFTMNAQSVSYTGNGSITTFAFPFPVFEPLEIEILIDGAVQVSGFTLLGDGANSGGAVVFATAPANGKTVILRRTGKTQVSGTDAPGFLDAKIVAGANVSVTKTTDANGEHLSIAADANPADFLAKAQNLADLPNAATARSNLGLAAVAASGSYTDLSNKPNLGTAAALNVDTDPTLAANSDSLVPSQKAVKTYVDTKVANDTVIIDGNFDIWSQGTSYTASGYWADLWRGDIGGGATISRETFTLGQTNVPGEPRYFLRHHRTTAAAAANTVLEQRIEGVGTLADTRVAVTMFLAANAAKTFRVDLVQCFGTGGSPSSNVALASQAVDVTTGWQRYDLVFDMPSIAGKTIGSDDNDYLALRLREEAGFSTFTLDVAQVAMAAGSNVLFHRRPLQAEKALAGRYFERIGPTFNLGFGAGFFLGASFVNIETTYAEKRAIPAISFSAMNTFLVNSSNGGLSVSSFSFSNLGLKGGRIGFNLSASGTAGQGCILMDNSVGTAYMDLDARL